MTKQIIEACVSSLSECIAAENNGADQLELCSRLDLDGLTPEISLISAALLAVKIPIKVMIRPREGDFTYNQEEMDQIREQIDACKSIGVTHFVYGSIAQGRLDINDIITVYNYILAENYPLKSFTIHKAIDTSMDPIEDLKGLLSAFPFEPDIKLAVLTSGAMPTAIGGAELLNQMIALVGQRIEIIAAGKVTADNLDQVKKSIPCHTYHGRRIVSLE